MNKNSLNVLGDKLEPCCLEPATGYFRDGFCHTDQSDRGTHTVCAVMTDDFLSFTKSLGNDLSTPAPQYNFRGLSAGDKWCLCAMRWKQAFDAGFPPPVILSATNIKTLELVPLEALLANEYITRND